MLKNDLFTNNLAETILNRRSFLKWSAVLGGTTALAGPLGIGLQAAATAAQAATKTGKWIPAACWGDCGSKAFNTVHVVDGIVVQGGTDDTIKDSADCPQLRACARGRAQRTRILGADRLKYPMKRKNWAPGGGKKELRGKDEWVRISWDEALDIFASELKRIKEKYGNTAIYSPTPSTASVYTEVSRTLSLFGGFISDYASCSSGTWTDTGVAIGLPRSRLNTGEDFNDWTDLPNSKLIVLWAYNPAWSRAGYPSYALLQAKKAGAKFICVDPFFNPTAQAMGVASEDWYPCRPATDHAFVLGMAHTLIVEDDPKTNRLIDWDFLNRCTVGFDKDHMPEGADPKENFRDYVLGTFDGQPKNAEWAAEICGIPAARIKGLALEIAKTAKVSIMMSPAPARVNNADSWPQAITTFGAMTGHMGKSGSMVGSDGGHAWLAGGPPIVYGGTWIGRPSNFPKAPPVRNPIDIRINRNQVWEAVLTGKYTAGKDKQADINIQMLHFAKTERINQVAGSVKAIEAFRKVEFVAVQEHFLTSTAKYADLVLPATTLWERYGSLSPAYREQIVWTSQVMEPLFECKDDVWMARELGVKLGLDPKAIQPYSPAQDIINQVAAATILAEDGVTKEPLVTITDEDLRTLGVEGKPQKGRIPILEFKEKGIYHVPRKPGDKHTFIMLKDFRDDPVKNKLSSKSGKIEIHCQTLVDVIASRGFSTVRPIPTYNRPIEGYEDTFSDWDKKIKGPYPLQFIGLHVPRHSHSMFANTPWLREAFPHMLLINPVDAAERGLKDGETALIKSRHGKVLRNVRLFEQIRPGVVVMGEGAWVELDDTTGIDKAGCSNVLSGAISTGQGHQGWNSTNVQVEKWTGAPLPPDYKWPQRIVSLGGGK